MLATFMPRRYVGRHNIICTAKPAALVPIFSAHNTRGRSRSEIMLATGAMNNHSVAAVSGLDVRKPVLSVTSTMCTGNMEAPTTVREGANWCNKGRCRKMYILLT